MARRLHAIGVRGYESGFTEVNIRPERLNEPLKRKRATMYFVNSMSDLFHPGIPGDFVHKTFDVMGTTAQHIFQVLTKRPERMKRILHDRPLPQHIWLGVSVEDRRYGVPRIAVLRGLLGFSEEARNRSFPCPPLGGFGFVKINYSRRMLARIGQFSIGINRCPGR